MSLVGGRVVHLVAKVARPGRFEPVLYEQEVGFYQRMSERIDCVPRAHFAAVDRDGRFLLILDRAEGEHLPEGFDEVTARAALAAIATVHGACWGDEGVGPRRVFSPSEAQHLVDGVSAGWDVVSGRLPRHMASPPLIADLAAEAALLLPITLTHNDLHAQNVLVDEDRVTFVDWQNATFGHPMLDVANLIAGCVRPDVQRRCWRSLLAHYEASLRRAGGPELSDVVAQYATASGLLFAWVCEYVANASEAEVEARSMLLQHWERVCTGVVLPR